MYVAVKGGERAIGNAHRLLARRRRGDTAIAELTVAQIREQLALAVDRVMTEGSLYDRDLAALAIKQARGDLVEAIFLIRAFRTTLPRFSTSTPIETREMAVERRVSAAYKDVPGGQVLGPTFDYSHRLLDFSLLDSEHEEPAGDDAGAAEAAIPDMLPLVTEVLNREGLIEEPSEATRAEAPGDLTRQPLRYPVPRDTRLQALTRGDEGYLLGLAYSTQRGYGRNHPFAGEIRFGTVAVAITPEELGFEIEIGTIAVTECQMINQFKGSAAKPPQFTRGYGIAFGHSERKTMAMALVDRALRARELDEDVTAPAQDEEFVLAHADNVEASGFVQHLKLPHYVDFQSELELIRRLRRELAGRNAQAAE